MGNVFTYFWKPLSVYCMWELDPDFQEGSFKVDFALSELTCLFFPLGLETATCKLRLSAQTFFSQH